MPVEKCHFFQTTPPRPPGDSRLPPTCPQWSTSGDFPSKIRHFPASDLFVQSVSSLFETYIIVLRSTTWNVTKIYSIKKTNARTSQSLVMCLFSLCNSQCVMICSAFFLGIPALATGIANLPNHCDPMGLAIDASLVIQILTLSNNEKRDTVGVYRSQCLPYFSLISEAFFAAGKKHGGTRTLARRRHPDSCLSVNATSKKLHHLISIISNMSTLSTTSRTTRPNPSSCKPKRLLNRKLLEIQQSQLCFGAWGGRL